ncbi:hypothetical protein [Marinobacterium jannaschii]|uniref:hypothetical protein n=1 Tax=Marinobacterium jannaschii TaxID=64970 RepID=UPI00048257BE|nr:hypothetical protein [Marinobacterium jannaschii]
MKKSDKKTEAQICQALTDVCDIALDQVAGFEWITHQVNYNRFPHSLQIVCVFRDEAARTALLLKHEDLFLRQLIVDKLAGIGVKLPRAERQISFDSEEACQRDHAGRWNHRLSSS